MTQARYDAIVVGGGHNGLVAAGYLAKERLKVLVLERRPIIGGACVTEELIPGYRVTRTSYVCSLLLPEVIRDFRMKDYGFMTLVPEPHSIYPYPDGRYMLWSADEAKTKKEVAKFSRRDAEAFSGFNAELLELQSFVDEIMRTTPPMFPPRGLRELLEFGKLGRKMLKLGDRKLKLFMELMTASCYDYLSRRFESDHVMAAMSINGLIGTCVGPMTPGSAAIRKFRIQGSSIKVNCALSELPNWTCIPGQDPNARHQQAMFEIAPSVEYLERAYDDLKYGRPSVRPMIDGNIASTMDDSLCPKGHHVMSLFVQYGPYKLKEGTWDQVREKVGDQIIDTLAEYAPNIKKAIIAREVLSPWDLEKIFGLTEGNIFHGEMTPDQLFFLRPAPRWANYRTPIRGLYLCGSGAHPGGGVMGAPGKNAAREILRDLRR